MDLGKENISVVITRSKTDIQHSQRIWTVPVGRMKASPDDMRQRGFGQLAGKAGDIACPTVLALMAATDRPPAGGRSLAALSAKF